MVISIRLTKEEEKKYTELLNKSGLSKSDFLRQSIFNTNIISSKDSNRYKQVYESMLRLNSYISELKDSHKDLDINNIEMEMNRICHIL